MKKLVTLFLSLCLVLSLSLAGAEGFTPGTYEASAPGFNTAPDAITVKVTVDEKAITAVEIEGEGEQPYGVPAFPGMAEALLGKDSAEFDAVAGATMSSNGVKEAVEKALAAARGEAVDNADRKSVV